MNFGQGKVREFHFRLRVGTLNKINIAFSDWVIVKNLINSKLISELVSSDKTVFLCNNATQV